MTCTCSTCTQLKRRLEVVVESGDALHLTELVVQSTNSREEAEDLLQRTLVYLLEKHRPYEDRDDIKGFLKNTLRWQASNFKRHKKNRVVFEDIDKVAEYGLKVKDPYPFQDLLIDLKSALDRVEWTPYLEDLFNKYVFEEYTVKEMAVKESISQDTMYGRVRKARNAIKDLMNA